MSNLVPNIDPTSNKNLGSINKFWNKLFSSKSINIDLNLYIDNVICSLFSNILDFTSNVEMKFTIDTTKNIDNILDNTFILPLDINNKNLRTSNIFIDWNDGKTTTLLLNTNINLSDISHTYSILGKHQIIIKSGNDTLPDFNFYNYNNINNNNLKLISIDSSLLKLNTLNNKLDYIFYNCKNLEYVHKDIFNNNGNTISFSNAFANNIKLLKLPELLFNKNKLSLDYSYCFYNCFKLEYNPYIFSDMTDIHSRYIGERLNLNHTFYRDEYTNLKSSIVPEVWKYLTKKTVNDGTFCGEGNNELSITNYDVIPISYCGPLETFDENYKFSFTIDTTKNPIYPLDNSFILPFVNDTIREYDLKINWGDNLEPQLITKSTNITQSLLTHYYNKSGQYQISIYSSNNKNMPNYNFYNNYSNINYNSVKLISIDSPLFTIDNIDFSNMFNSCSNLNSINSSIFINNEQVINVYSIFSNCTNLSTISDNLFEYNLLITNFSYCFYNNFSLNIKSNIFGLDYENRFSKVSSIDFSNMFYRNSYNGVLNDENNNAPELWNFNITNSIKTGCFCNYIGNNITSLSNYNIIPSEWCGTYISNKYEMKFTIDTTKNIISDNTFILPMPLLSSNRNYDFKILWGDGLETLFYYNTSINQSLLTHNYTIPGTYNISIRSTQNRIPEINFYNFNTINNNRLKLISIDTSLLNYYTNSLENLFYNCSNLNSIPNNLFIHNKNCINFNYAFFACSSLKNVSGDIFKYNSKITTLKSTFSNCTSLININKTIFDNLPELTDVSYCFNNCTNLENIIDEVSLFNFNLLITNFSYCFNNCNKFVFKENIFCELIGDYKAIRFVNQTMNFNNTFYREVYTGDLDNISKAPDIWKYNMEFSFNSDCFSINTGNNADTISNYNIIPMDWGGSYIDDTYMIELTIDTTKNNSTDRNFTMPITIINNRHYNFKISWGDGIDSIFYRSTTLTQSSLTHTYDTPGIYHIIIRSTQNKIAAINFYNNYRFVSNNVLKLISIDSPMLNFINNNEDPVVNVANIFRTCSNLESVVNDIFKYNDKISSLSYGFSDCTSLININKIVFDNLPELTNVSYCFNNCSNLEKVIDNESLFDSNLLVDNFSYCFQNCNKLVFKENIFCNLIDNYKDTRFADQTIDFTNCFYRENYTGDLEDISTAPDLWEYNIKSSIKIKCFSSSTGNNSDSISNYDMISMDWGGPYISDKYFMKFSIDTTKNTNNTSDRTYILPLILTTRYYSIKILWGDGLESKIYPWELLSQSLLTHTYNSPGQYQISIYSINNTIPNINFYTNFRTINNNGLKLISIDTSLLKYYNLTSLQYLCYGCSNLISIPNDMFINNEQITNMGYVFSNCSNLVSIPEGLFDNNLLVESFTYCFANNPKLKLNKYIFDSKLNITTRFANNDMNFNYCFYRTSYNKNEDFTNSFAPEIWNYTMKSYTSKSCFASTNGNNINNIVNYNDIPSIWK